MLNAVHVLSQRKRRQSHAFQKVGVHSVYTLQLISYQEALPSATSSTNPSPFNSPTSYSVHQTTDRTHPRVELSARKVVFASLSTVSYLLCISPLQPQLSTPSSCLAIFPIRSFPSYQRFTTSPQTLYFLRSISHVVTGAPLECRRKSQKYAFSLHFPLQIGAQNCIGRGWLWSFSKKKSTKSEDKCMLRVATM